MKPINRTLSDHLVEAMRERILSSQLSPDQPIRQDVLAAEMGVSKIPLREALARLEQEGLLGRTRIAASSCVRSAGRKLKRSMHCA